MECRWMMRPSPTVCAGRRRRRGSRSRFLKHWPGPASELSAPRHWGWGVEAPGVVIITGGEGRACAGGAGALIAGLTACAPAQRENCAQYPRSAESAGAVPERICPGRGGGGAGARRNHRTAIRGSIRAARLFRSPTAGRKGKRGTHWRRELRNSQLVRKPWGLTGSG